MIKMKRLIMPIITLVLLLFFAMPANGNEYTLRVNAGILFVEINQPSWVNQSAPVLLGVDLKGFSIAYGVLHSEALNSGGDRLKLGYLYRTGKISPGLDVVIDYYRRSNQGGVSITGKVDWEIIEGLSLQAGVSRGWLTDFTPYLALSMEVF